MLDMRPIWRREEILPVISAKENLRIHTHTKTNKQTNKQPTSNSKRGKKTEKQFSHVHQNERSYKPTRHNTSLLKTFYCHEDLPGQRQRPIFFPTTDAIVSPMPRESIPEYSESLQPKAQNTDTEVILNGLEAALESAIKIPIFKLQLTRRLRRPFG